MNSPAKVSPTLIEAFSSGRVSADRMNRPPAVREACRVESWSKLFIGPAEDVGWTADLGVLLFEHMFDIIETTT
jgi:hypothetical protein